MPTYTITHVALHAVALPYVEPLKTSFGVEADKAAVLVEVTLENGVTGWGECAVEIRPGYGAETIFTALHVLNNFLIPKLVGQPLSSPKDAAALLRSVLLGFLGWIETSRLIRGQVIVQKRRDYVLAAQAVGASKRYVMLHHIFPNVIPIAIISLTISAGSLILAESGLSFLGLGVQQPTPTWGNMLSDARDYFFRGAYLVVSPGILITATVLCFYLIGDGLRDALDPRSRG